MPPPLPRPLPTKGGEEFCSAIPRAHAVKPFFNAFAPGKSYIDVLLRMRNVDPERLRNQTMPRKYFGTDGIRGRANGVITADLALRVGQAAGVAFRRGDHRHRVVIGKDTRLSGYMIEYALVAGFTSVGMNAFLLGPMPTPAVAMLTRSMRADLGVMISASHNPYDDNGIKLFGPQGFKLSDDVEKQIEQLLDESLDKRPPHRRRP